MPRLPGLDLLRSIAIVWVMLFHSFVAGGLGPDFQWLSRFGWMGVDIFFVLSGFLIGTQVLRPLQRGEGLAFQAFYARRAWRVLPAFVVVLALYQCFPVLREDPGLEPWWVFATFTLNLLIDYGHNTAFSHAWSLCVEEHFYLLFPFIAWWLARRPAARRMLTVCAAIALLGLALRTGVWLHNDALNPPRPWFIEDIYYPSWMRLDGLLMGVMLAVLRVYRPDSFQRLQARSNQLLLSALALWALALLLFSNRTGLLANAIGWPVLSLGFGLLVLAATDPAGLLGRWTLPGTAWLAKISYSLYLSHKIAMHLVHQMVAPVLSERVQGVALFSVYALAVLAVGATLHYLVELPFLRWRDRRASFRSAISKPVAGDVLTL
ncbi:MAG: acyltransferase [Proteobacteria bacterium]|jgi:peptidoglycan/LPS O-acetylase OafA/YrhL|nr:acyltransferase [Methylibium sp.]MBY0365683.1 acyltransferase [Burkholderiaceae bacterium]MCH8855791.1 acyltransferase [Pseudomonadota bacterium]|mmetsp:Transcript_1410/g.4194  ORF Transcript_1410/g.4194 Transcript_1410/m.4194 type:complete len:378 (+) Transcript_1410:3179-4312(+)